MDADDISRKILLASMLVGSSPSAATETDFSLFGILDFVKKINYDFIETFAKTELRKLWDKEVGNFLLCTGLHPTSGTAGWGIYSKEDLEKYACDEKWKIKRLTQLGEKLSDIFEDDSLTQDEKAFTVAAQIEEDALNYYAKYPNPPPASA